MIFIIFIKYDPKHHYSRALVTALAASLSHA